MTQPICKPRADLGARSSRSTRDLRATRDASRGLELHQRMIGRHVVEEYLHRHIDAHTLRRRGDVGCQARSFSQLDNREHVRRVGERAARRSPHDRIAVDFAATAHALPPKLVRETFWASIARIVNVLAANAALLNRQFVAPRRLPEWTAGWRWLRKRFVVFAHDLRSSIRLACSLMIPPLPFT